MKEHVSTPDARQVARLHSTALRRLPFLKGHLTLEMFADGVSRSVAQRFRADPPGPEVVAAYVDSLQIGDLALAVACEVWNERAWEHVVITYRPILYRAASILTADEGVGRELADALVHNSIEG